MAESALPLVIGGGASALGNYFGAQAASNAASQSAALQQQRYSQAAANQQPYIQDGQNALNLYNNAVGVNGAPAQQAYYSGFQTDPGFQSSVNYGIDRLNARAAAQGQNLSGNALAGISDYAQKNLNEAYNTRLGDLFQESQLGANSANALTNASTASANNQGNYNLVSGQYRGAGYANAGNNAYGAAKDAAAYYYGNRRSS